MCSSGAYLGGGRKPADELAAFVLARLREEDPQVLVLASDRQLLPAHGATTESRTITDLEDKIRDLIVLRTDADLRMPYEDAVRGLDLKWTYDLPDGGAKVLREYVESKRNLAAAQEQYAELSQQAVYTLHVKARASVRRRADAGLLVVARHQACCRHNQPLLPPVASTCCLL